MSAPHQPQRIFRLRRKELIVVGLIAVALCVGIGAAAVVISHVASTIFIALRVTPTDTPDPYGDSTADRYPTTLCNADAHTHAGTRSELRQFITARLDRVGGRLASASA